MDSSISSISGSSSAAAQTPPSQNTSTQLVGEDVFLKLLVSQIKNQDPLNPMDGMSFVTQLAQFSQLETMFGIRGDLQALLTRPQASNSAPATNSGSATNQTQAPEGQQ